MTRINANLEPRVLLDQHLMAEYRELPMVYAALNRTLKSYHEDSSGVDKILKRISPTFTLNTGHVMFFYDKLLFLHNRYHRLIAELKNRGFSLDDSRQYSIVPFDKRFKNQWDMTSTDKQVICQRIMEKFDMKPTWYKYMGKSIDRDTYMEILNG